MTVTADGRPAATPLVLSVLAALLALGAALAGLGLPGFYDGVAIPGFEPGIRSQDTVTLAAAAALLAAVIAIRRGSVRAWLLWLGLLGYLIYGYLLYAFDRLYAPAYPVFLAVAALSIYAVILFFNRANLGAVAAVVGPQAPRRAVAALLAILAVFFAGLWLSMLIPALRARSPLPGNTIIVLDLVFVLPLLLVAARLLWQGRQLGDVLALPLLVKTATLGISVMIGALYAPLFGRTVDWGEVAIYAAMGLLPLAFGLWFWRHTSASAGREAPRPPP